MFYGIWCLCVCCVYVETLLLICIKLSSLYLLISFSLKYIFLEKLVYFCVLKWFCLHFVEIMVYAFTTVLSFESDNSKVKCFCGIARNSLSQVSFFSNFSDLTEWSNYSSSSSPDSMIFIWSILLFFLHF